MSDRYINIYMGITELSVVLFSWALMLKYSYEERNYDTRSSWMLFIYNVIVFAGHMDFFITGRLFFMHVVENSGIRWLSFALAMFHGALMLMPIRQRGWFIFKRFDPRL